MALARTAQPILLVSGKVVGTYYHRDRSGLHLTACPRRINKQSTLRNNQLLAYRHTVELWNTHPWTPHELDSWNTYAATHPITNRIGEPKQLSAYSAFLKVNIPRVRWGIGPTYYPPQD